MFNEKFIVSREVEKMSKSKFNVVSPDKICDKYGADTLRMYEMFLGPLEQSKPWNMDGKTGVHNFLKKFWNLFHDESGFNVLDTKPNENSLKILHKTIKKINSDIINRNVPNHLRDINKKWVSLSTRARIIGISKDCLLYTSDAADE